MAKAKPKAKRAAVKTAAKKPVAKKPGAKKSPAKKAPAKKISATATRAKRGAALRETLPYRPCVGVMLLNDDGLVFVGNRVDQTMEAWQMPQGGIDKGETPRQAVMRELKEETGTDKAEIIREHDKWLNYELPDELIGVVWKGKYRGQTQKWFALRFLGDKEDIDLSGHGHDQEFSNWKWARMEDLPKLVVPFKRTLYKKIVKAFADLAGPAMKKAKTR